MKFKDSELAHKYCIGEGIEIGGAAHNPFNLENCINIAPKIDELFYQTAQKSLCNEITKIDLYAPADNIPLNDNSKDYVISSHVVEHIPDLIGAFKEWNRILKKDGIIFIIAPKRNALPSDIGRPLSKIPQFVKAHKLENKGKVDIDNHIWVFDLKTMINLINYCNLEHNLDWKITEQLETDDKVGNGHLIVCRKV